jgi:hypothetical protein
MYVNQGKEFMLTMLAGLTLLKMKNKVFCLTFVVQCYPIH